MSIRERLNSNKIYFETVAATALTLMAIILAWNSNRLNELQIHLLTAQNQPIFRMELRRCDAKGETDSSRLLIYNDGLPLTNPVLDLVETLVVVVDVFDESDNEKEISLRIPTFAYWAGTSQYAATKGLLFELTHEDQTKSPSQLTYMFRDVGIDKDPTYQGADIQLEVVLRITYRDVFGEGRTQYMILDYLERTRSLSESSGKVAFNEHKNGQEERIDYRDIDNEKLGYLWDRVLAKR